MTPNEANTKLMSLLDSLQTELGGQWSVDEGPNPLSCEVGTGTGITWSVLRFGPTPVDLAAAERSSSIAAAVLEEAGFDVTSTYQDELGYMVVARNGRGSSVDFGANTNAMNLGAYSDCVPGDMGAVIEELNRR